MLVLSDMAISSVLEQSVVVKRGVNLVGDVLDDVPMLDHFAVLDPEDVDDAASWGTRHEDRVYVQYDQVAFSNDTFDLISGMRMVLSPELDESQESFWTICDQRVVLDIGVAQELLRFGDVSFVKGGFVERQYHLSKGRHRLGHGLVSPGVSS